MPALLALPLLLAQLHFVESSAQCPRADAVEARVRGILGLGAQQGLPERVTIARQGATVQLALRGEDGSVVGERTLSATGNCEELEVVVSVVLASWLSDVHPEFVAALPPPAPPPEVAPPPEPAAEKPRQRMRALLAAGIGADFAGEQLSLAGSLGVRWLPRRSGLGVALSVNAVWPREQSLSLGSVRYWRWPLLLGPAWRAPLGPAFMELHAGAALAWLHVEGEGFEPSLSRDALRLGGVLSARVMHGGERLKAFIELGGLAWGRTEAFIVRGQSQLALPLPSVELYALVGAVWSAR